MRPRGFTIIELLLVVSIILVMLGILMPVISGSQRRAAEAACMNNLGQIMMATKQYTKDNREYYMAGSGMSEWNVVGRNALSSSFWSLSAYGCGSTSSAAAPVGQVTVAECPLDSGDDDDSNNNPSSYGGTNGSSYLFPFNGVSSTNYNAAYQVVNPTGKRTSVFTAVAKKVIFHEPALRLDRTIDKTTNHWHSSSEPLRVGAGFADGHAAVIPRNTSAAAATTLNSAVDANAFGQGKDYY